ncbi:Uncharacterised protein [Bordetella pertussis]|nr:Uncharacterised protein [Bordetella pertussis]
MASRALPWRRPAGTAEASGQAGDGAAPPTLLPARNKRRGLPARLAAARFSACRYATISPDRLTMQPVVPRRLFLLRSSDLEPPAYGPLRPRRRRVGLLCLGDGDADFRAQFAQCGCQHHRFADLCRNAPRADRQGAAPSVPDAGRAVPDGGQRHERHHHAARSAYRRGAAHPDRHRRSLPSAFLAGHEVVRHGGQPA